MNKLAMQLPSDADVLACLQQLPTRLPAATPGWNGHIPFLFLLFQLARPRTYVELGVHYGTSFGTACDAAKRSGINTRCYGVDTWQGDPHAGNYDGDPIYQELCAHLATHYPPAELIRSTFDDAVHTFEDGSIDVLHIDGLHSYVAVSHDFQQWLPKLSERAVVLLHDIDVRERGFEVWKFWSELRYRYQFLEFKHSNGLGVLLTGSEATDFAGFVRRLKSNYDGLMRFIKHCEAAAATLPMRFAAANDLSQAAPAAETAQPVPARNAACPCGSGLKYKHCHGRLAEPGTAAEAAFPATVAAAARSAQDLGGGEQRMQTRSSSVTIEVICVAYRRYGPLKLLVQSLLNQFSTNWKLSVYHDGHDSQFERLMETFKAEAGDKITYACTERRYNDWGHSLRDEGLKHVTSDYVLITNDDNYYVPTFVSAVTEAITGTDPDVILFDMVHSHEGYAFFPTEYRRHRVDIGSAVVRSSLAVKAGFRDKSFEGDATYFEDIAAAKGEDLKICKINQVLFVHN